MADSGNTEPHVCTLSTVSTHSPALYHNTTYRLNLLSFTADALKDERDEDGEYPLAASQR